MSNNPSTNEPNFYNLVNFPVYRYDDTNDSCLGTTASMSQLNPLSVSINQADHDISIYDQQKNVVYYSVQFGKSLCGAPQTGNLPTDTLELKMAWKVLGAEDDPSKFINITKNLTITTPDGQMTQSNVTLGLAGLHVVQATPNHPEMIWTTFEHKDNAPDCYPTTTIPKDQYNFISNTCAAKLNSGDVSDASCQFNQATKQSKVTGERTEICRVFAHGSDINNPLYYQNSEGVPYDSPSKYEQNVSTITQLNLSVQGNYYASMPVLKNYFIAGSIWESDTKLSSKQKDNLRGSLENANTMMETSVQGILPVVSTQPSGATDCFGCHGYTPDNTASTGLSHIFNALQPVLKNTIKPHDFTK